MIDLSKLQNGVRVLAQFSRRDNADGTAPKWSEPRTVTLYVQRREKTIKRGRTTYPAGEIITITPQDFGWAEYSERDYSPEFNEWLIEEYRMRILGVL